MPRLHTVATHLPVWSGVNGRAAGPDEDAVTLAAAAGLAALGTAGEPVKAVVLVSRDHPLLEGGEGVLLAALDLSADTHLTAVIGGAPAALDAVCAAAPGTLVIGVDVAPAAAAAAALVGGTTGCPVSSAGRSARSLPVRVRDTSGRVHDYADPRLQRVRGSLPALARLGLDGTPLAVAGLPAGEVASLTGGGSSPLPTTGAAAPLFALADAAEAAVSGVLVAVEQASASAARIGTGASIIVRDEPDPLPLPSRRSSGDAVIKISLPAYERAFDGKLRLAAGRCDTCGTLDLPQRYRCSGCGTEGASTLVPMPRTATVYTAISVHVPVPGLPTPYDLAIVELGDTGVRLLAPVTGAAAGSVGIGDCGTLVLRRVAVRTGVPDYGYAFLPGAGRWSPAGDATATTMGAAT